jgi:hypothetical protein
MLSEYAQVYRGLLREVRKAVSMVLSTARLSSCTTAGAKQAQPDNCCQSPVVIGAIKPGEESNHAAGRKERSLVFQVAAGAPGVSIFVFLVLTH